MKIMTVVNAVQDKISRRASLSKELIASGASIKDWAKRKRAYKSATLDLARCCSTRRHL